ncbi:MAG: DUF817 domain-containing protein [Fimbriimonas sp.]
MPRSSVWAQFVDFVRKEALSCVFPVGIFACLAIGKALPISGVPRYDVILGFCLALQLVVLKTGLETREEARASLIFHGCGLLLELYKVRMGSWSYPGFAYSKIADVPLYSGFMYASVAGYIHQAWRRFDLEFRPWPPERWAIAVAAGVYANFFTHHFWWDLRWVLAGLVLVVFGRTWVSFDVAGERRRMPLCLSFVLIGLFVWFAENIATGLGAWAYPDQRSSWTFVHPGKVGSWSLLVIVTFVVVALQKRKPLRHS